MLDLPSLVTSARAELGVPAPIPKPPAPKPALDEVMSSGSSRGILGPSSTPGSITGATDRTLRDARVELPAAAAAPAATEFRPHSYGDSLIAPHLLARPATPRYDAVHRTVEQLGGRYRPAMQALEDVANGSRGVLGAADTTALRSARGIASRELSSLFAQSIAHGQGRLARAPRMEGNSVDLLVRNEQYLPRLYDDLRGAQNSITVNQFNWEHDGGGAIVADILRQQAAKGLDVRVIVDGYGINEKGRQAADDFQRSLEDVGVKFERTDGFRPGGNGFEHRKMISVDDRVAYTGGLGFGEKYDTWTDLMLRIEGPAAAVASGSQLATFRDLSGSADERLLARAERIGSSLRDAAAGARGLAATPPAGGPLAQTRSAAVTLLDNTPGVDLASTEAFLRDAASATKRFWATSTYLTTDAAKQALVDAARRGVDVKLLVTGPKAGNDTKQLWLGRTLMSDMLDAGVEVYEYPTILHAKSWLRDDDVAAVGSMNLSKSSMARAREVTARVEDEGVAQRYARFHEDARANAERVTPRDLDSTLVRALGVLNKVGLQF